jgi:transposase
MRATGEIRQPQLSLAVLGNSNYTYSELTWSQDHLDWVASHRRAFDCFGGVVEIVAPDNPKCGATNRVRARHQHAWRSS